MSDPTNQPSPTPPRDAEAAASALDDDHETVVAVFGNTTRGGSWLPPERMTAIAGFGNVKLDYCKADLPPGETEVNAFAVFGNVIVTVPKALDVEANGLSLFGSIETKSAKSKTKRLLGKLGLREPQPPLPAGDDDAFLTIHGTAIFGKILVKVQE